jgi:mono/diheme cytochrome c family protein
MCVSPVSPTLVSSDYYYKLPVTPIYRSYPVYAPGHEPPGYMEWLKQQEPKVVWDDKGHAPPLKTNADWIKAGEIAFDAPILTSIGPRAGDDMYVRNPVWYRETGAAVAQDGTLRFYRYVISEKGSVQIMTASCASCHTRVMSDGTIVKGAQGNFSFDRAFALDYRSSASTTPNARILERLLYEAPWVRPNPYDVGQLARDDFAQYHDVIPPGVLARHGSSPPYPVQVPDLIGVKDRHYLDRTGLQQQRSMADLMRYAALNQVGDLLASYDGFVPGGAPDFKEPPDPQKFGRPYSDEQLYALALYVYSLKPPPSPNRFDVTAARGQEVFSREGCAGCHTPPLYTNNKLTLAEGFTPRPGATEKYDIMPISVGTDPSLALKTRRGTGYYKVPSLKGVWYRSMFGHSGSCATLEDWFDPRRLRSHRIQAVRGQDLRGERASFRTRSCRRRQEGAHRIPEEPVNSSPEPGLSSHDVFECLLFCQAVTEIVGACSAFQERIFGDPMEPALDKHQLVQVEESKLRLNFMPVQRTVKQKLVSRWTIEAELGHPLLVATVFQRQIPGLLVD